MVPDATAPLVFKYTSNANKTDVRFTAAASYFGNRELLRQAVLRICWRVCWSQDDQDCRPAPNPEDPKGPQKDPKRT